MFGEKVNSLITRYNGVLIKLNEYQNDLKKVAVFKKGIYIIVSECLNFFRTQLELVVSVEDKEGFDYLLNVIKQFQTLTTSAVDELEGAREGSDRVYEAITVFKRDNIPIITQKIKYSVSDSISKKNKG